MLTTLATGAITLALGLGISIAFVDIATEVITAVTTFLPTAPVL